MNFEIKVTYEYIDNIQQRTLNDDESFNIRRFIIKI